VLMRGNRCVLVAVAPVAGCLSSDVFTNTRVVGKRHRDVLESTRHVIVRSSY
jgi:hypothetical protein